jgi:hypothetical protein
MVPTVKSRKPNTSAAGGNGMHNLNVRITVLAIPAGSILTMRPESAVEILDPSTLWAPPRLCLLRTRCDAHKRITW